ncbi:MAG: tetratricopeptide repeat protein, partial [Candidatus Hydrogenedentota bacterium]
MHESAQQNHDKSIDARDSVLTDIPFVSNPAFASRRTLLQSIQDRLLEKRRLAVIGTPSRLKTQCQTEFAIEVAHLCHEHFDSIWWIPGGCRAGLPGAFAEIAFALDLPEKDCGEQTAVISAVQKRLTRDARCLFVFDNITEPEIVDSLIPENSDACVLTTSYREKWPDPQSAVTIPDFRPDEMEAFLRARLGRAMNAVDEECAFQLGGVPLLLHLYAGCARFAPSRKENLRKTLLQVAEQHGPGEGTNVDTYLDHLLKNLLAVLWDSEKLTANLFALAAFMGSQPVNASTLFDGITYLPQSLNQGLADTSNLPHAFRIMQSAGLARIGDNAFAIPAVLQERFVSMLGRDKKESWCTATVNFLANVFPFKEEHTQFDLQCSQLLGHASTAATWAECIGCALEDAGRLLNQIGLYLRACGQREEAIKYYLHAIACGETIDGANHPKVAVRINNLAVVYRETGRLDEARDAFRRAIRIFKEVYGPADHMLAMAVRNLVTVAEDSKDEQEMERAYRRALRIYADSLGHTHPYVHECLYSLGRLLRKRGDAKGAQRCFEEALRCALLCTPPDEEAIALYSRNFGRALLRAGEAHAAQEHLQTAVALQRKRRDPAGGTLAQSLYELGNAYRVGKQFPEARKCLEEALRLCRTGKPNSQLQVRILTQLARVLGAQGN